MPEIIDATVIAVLSGDILLVKSCSDLPAIPRISSRSPYVVAILPIACTPALAIFSRNNENDPFAIESLDFTRGLLHGRQVQLTYIAPSSQTFSHQTLGEIPVAVFVVTQFGGSGEMVDQVLISAGWGRVRPISQIPPRFTRHVNHDPEDAALKKKIGIWGEPRQRIDPMQVGQFDSVIVSINRDFTFKLLEPPIDVELVGVVERAETQQTPECGVFFGEYVLFQKASVRVLARSLNAPHLVSMTIGGHDLSATLLTEGFAQLNEITARHLSDVDRFKEPPPAVGTFQATVKSIPSSSTVAIASSTGEHRITVASIHSRQFDFQSSGETHGFESWRFLRDAALGREVEITLLGPNFGQLSVDGRDVSEMMLRAGVADLGISRIHRRPSNIRALTEANAFARAERKGIYDTSPPRRPAPYRGTVAGVPSPTELCVYMPANDRYQLKKMPFVNVRADHNDPFSILKAIHILTKRFLHHEVDVPNTGIIRDPVGPTDPRVLLLRRGFLRVGEHPDRDLAEAQAVAQKAERGIWSPTFPRESLLLNAPAVVTHLLTPTRLIVQLLSEALQQIQSGLSKLLIKARKPIKSDTLYVMRVNWRTFRVQLFSKKSDQFFAVDYGFIVTRKMGGLFECPDEIRRIPPQCICCDLAYVTPFDDPVHSELVLKYMWNIFDSGAMYSVVIVRGGLIPAVILKEIPDGGLLQAVILKDGGVQLDRSQAGKTPFPEGLENCEKDAKRYQLGGWCEH